MNRIFQTILGIERPKGAEAAGGSRLEFTALPQGATAVAILAGAIAFLCVVWWLYRHERPDLSKLKRALMAGLRAAVLLALAAMLIEPVLISSQRETVKSHLAIVLDDSESMKFSDPYTDQSLAAQIASKLKLESAGGRSSVERLRETPRLALVKDALAKNLEALKKGREVFVYDLDSAARPGAGESARKRTLDDIQPNRAVSPVGDAIRGVLSGHRGQPVAGLVIATDGRSNAGEDPLRAIDAAVRQNIPIYAVAAGAGEGPRNVRLAEVEVSPVVFVRDPMTLAVVVEARGLRDAEATVVLEQRINENEWEGVGRERVVLGEDGILKRTTFRFTPRVVGQYEFRARVEDAGPELTQEDNVATAAVKVVRQQIRLLLIAGAPSPEIQFLRNALLRDQQVEFAGWMQHADPGYRQAGDRPISRLPSDSAELRQLRCPAPGRPRPARPGPAMARDDHPLRRPGRRRANLCGGRALFAAALRGRRQQGGAWATGPKSCRSSATPVCFAPRPRCGSSSQSTYSLDLTAEGRGDPVFEFNADPIRNRSILTSLPGMYWSFPVTRSRPGATVLARHGDPRMQNQYGRQPLLASQLFGPGRTVFIGFDSTYRWRYLSEDYFDGFWARLVDRVGRNKALGGRFPFTVHLSKSVYRVGDQINIGVRYTDPAALAEATELVAEIEIAGTPPEPLRFEKAADDPSLLDGDGARCPGRCLFAEDHADHRRHGRL